MSTLSTGIDLTTSFDASVLKKSVKKFATKAEVTVEFAKKVAAGGSDLSGIDLASVATSIHTNIDDDQLVALQQLEPTHLSTMATGTDITSTGVDVASKLKHFATKAEVVVEFAKVSVGTSTADASGNIDFSSISLETFVTSINSTSRRGPYSCIGKSRPNSHGNNGCWYRPDCLWCKCCNQTHTLQLKLKLWLNLQKFLLVEQI